MESQQKPSLVFTLLYIIAIFVLILIFKPFIAPLLLGGVLLVLLYPINKLIQKKVHNKTLSSSLMIMLVILVILIPGYFISSSIILESSKAYYAVSHFSTDELSIWINQTFNYEVNVSEYIVPVTREATSYITNNAVSFISSITDLVIAAFIMFFFMFYGFKEGDLMLKEFMKILPLKPKHKVAMMDETKKVLNGVLYGQFLVALVQGILGGIGFWIFGVSNPVLWGFVMVFMGFIPFLGTPIVWLPAVVLKFAEGHIAIAIGLLLYSAIIVTNIDNVIKPKIIGDSTGLHPVLVLIGIFGGMALFGLIGFIIGPVVVAISVMVIKFFNEELKAYHS